MYSKQSFQEIVPSQIQFGTEDNPNRMAGRGLAEKHRKDHADSTENTPYTSGCNFLFRIQHQVHLIVSCLSNVQTLACFAMLA